MFNLCTKQKTLMLSSDLYNKKKKKKIFIAFQKCKVDVRSLIIYQNFPFEIRLSNVVSYTPGHYASVYFAIMYNRIDC